MSLLERKEYRYGDDVGKCYQISWFGLTDMLHIGRQCSHLPCSQFPGTAAAASTSILDLVLSQLCQLEMLSVLFLKIKKLPFSLQLVLLAHPSSISPTCKRLRPSWNIEVILPSLRAAAL